MPKVDLATPVDATGNVTVHLLIMRFQPSMEMVLQEEPHTPRLRVARPALVAALPLLLLPPSAARSPTRGGAGAQAGWAHPEEHGSRKGSLSAGGAALQILVLHLVE